jgi:glutathione peroxidase
MLMRGIAMGLALTILVAGEAAAAPPTAPFASIDGGELSLSDWSGRPVLVVNTASLCAFTPQYDGLQALYDEYRDRGLVVLAVPSDDFRQELDSADEVREFCAMNFDLDLPMTDITPVKGDRAHPFYAWVRAETGFVPTWNFSKVLLGPSGDIVATWGPSVQPGSRMVREAVEKALN